MVLSSFLKPSGGSGLWGYGSGTKNLFGNSTCDPWNWLIQIWRKERRKSFLYLGSCLCWPEAATSEAQIPLGIKVFLSLLWEICFTDFLNHLWNSAFSRLSHQSSNSDLGQPHPNVQLSSTTGKCPPPALSGDGRWVKLRVSTPVPGFSKTVSECDLFPEDPVSRLSFLLPVFGNHSSPFFSFCTLSPKVTKMLDSPDPLRWLLASDTDPSLSYSVTLKFQTLALGPLVYYSQGPPPLTILEPSRLSWQEPDQNVLVHIYPLLLHTFKKIFY